MFATVMGGRSIAHAMGLLRSAKVARAPPERLVLVDAQISESSELGSRRPIFTALGTEQQNQTVLS